MWVANSKKLTDKLNNSAGGNKYSAASARERWGKLRKVSQKGRALEENVQRLQRNVVSAHEAGSLRHLFTGRPGYRLTLAVLASEATSQNDITVTRLLGWRAFAGHVMRKRKSRETRPSLPRRGKPCSAQRPGSLSSNSTTARSTSTASACRHAAPSAGRTWAPGSWRKRLSASLIRLPMGIKKSVPSSSDQLKGRFLGTVFYVLHWIVQSFPSLF